MAIKLSTGLRNAILATDSIKATFDAGSEIRIYGGTEPASADDSIGAAVLLVTIKNGANGITFAATATGGVLVKNAAETWSGANVATGTGTFYRHVLTADADDASTTAPRYQGSVASAGADMNLSSSALVSGATQTLDYHAVAIPAA